MTKINHTDADKQQIKNAYAILSDKPTWDSKTPSQQAEIVRVVLLGLVNKIFPGAS